MKTATGSIPKTLDEVCDLHPQYATQIRDVMAGFNFDLARRILWMFDNWATGLTKVVDVEATALERINKALEGLETDPVAESWFNSSGCLRATVIRGGGLTLELVAITSTAEGAEPC